MDAVQSDDQPKQSESMAAAIARAVTRHRAPTDGTEHAVSEPTIDLKEQSSKEPTVGETKNACR